MKFIKTLLLFLILSSCKNSADSDISIFRFDKDLVSIDSNKHKKNTGKRKL